MCFTGHKWAAISAFNKKVKENCCCKDEEGWFLWDHFPSTFSEVIFQNVQNESALRYLHVRQQSEDLKPLSQFSLLPLVSFIHRSSPLFIYILPDACGPPHPLCFYLAHKSQLLFLPWRVYFLLVKNIQAVRDNVEKHSHQTNITSDLLCGWQASGAWGGQMISKITVNMINKCTSMSPPPPKAWAMIPGAEMFIYCSIRVQTRVRSLQH